MSLDFAIGMNGLAKKYGRPISLESDPLQFGNFQAEAQIARNEIPLDAVIGNTATGAHIMSLKDGEKSVVTIDVSVLNESSFYMYEQQGRQLIGRIAMVACLPMLSKNTEIFTEDVSLAVDFSMHSDGSVELVYADFENATPQLETIYTHLGAPSVRLMDTKYGRQLDYSQDRFLNDDQVSKLKTFVTSSFIEV